MIILKDIHMTLDPASIELAIQAVEDLKNDLGKAMTHLIEVLTEQGVEFAKMELVMFPRPAVDTGALHDSISGAMLNDKEGVVTTGIMYAAFVEYGTGLIGEKLPHPDPEGWSYDVHGHGVDGWVYRSSTDGKFHWTLGYEARPFMFNTLLDLEEFAEQNGGQIIAEYIP